MDGGGTAAPLRECRSQIESSYSQPSRKFLLSRSVVDPHGMFAQPRRGRAWCGLPKAEATELAPEAVGTRPSHSDYNPGGLNRSPKRAFRFGQPIAYGETPERRLWA
jgi:hypothetical protein